MSEDVVKISKDYYDSDDADNFYHIIWGGEDIHIGIYDDDQITIKDASRLTVDRMIDKIDGLSKDTKILDIGAGFGGAARQIAKRTGAHVTCLNLSDAENKRNEEKNKEQGLDNLIDVVGGSFEELPFDDNSYDVVWSEDAILHSGAKDKVFQEIDRVLKPGGQLIFTDPMQSDDCPEGVLGPVLARIHLDSMGSFKLYRELAKKNGMSEVEIEDLSKYLPLHYGRVAKELESRKDEIKGKISDEYVERMLTGLGHWVEAGNKGHLAWGILHFKK